MTYPEQAVATEIAEHFVAVRVNSVDAGPVERGLAREFRQVWTPTVVFLDPHRIEVRRAIGYLPPQEFLPELLLARGATALLHGEMALACQLFRSIADDHPQADAAPEALYWAGVAGYRREGDREQLLRHWTDLQRRYPASAWWTRASFIAG